MAELKKEWYVVNTYAGQENRVRAGQHQWQQGTASRGDADHHGDLHQQDAQAQGDPQDDFNRGMLEGPDVRQYE